MEKKRPSILSRLKASIGKIGTLNIVLVLVGAFFLWFNWQMISMFLTVGQIPETYACAVVAATIGECGICGWIRTTKDRKREREWQKETRTAQITAPLIPMDELSIDNEETLPAVVNGQYGGTNHDGEEEVNG